MLGLWQSQNLMLGLVILLCTVVYFLMLCDKYTHQILKLRKQRNDNCRSTKNLTPFYCIPNLWWFKSLCIHGVLKLQYWINVKNMVDRLKTRKMVHETLAWSYLAMFSISLGSVCFFQKCFCLKNCLLHWHEAKQNFWWH